MNPQRTADQYEGYHSFETEAGETYGSCEVFWDDGGNYLDPHDPRAEARRGWYWHACFPGYLPDGDASGPFETSDEAYADAREI